ncbi:hypothetical protein [Burkholderia ubonensis]|uniref:hypothetical protein n=1 Tax=Burkholderia ubonensis TaxID=101571 RepID=UPI0012F9A79A|nr:hypothetical protein [Burkholderia ubonensis]
MISIPAVGGGRGFYAIAKIAARFFDNWQGRLVFPESSKPTSPISHPQPVTPSMFHGRNVFLLPLKMAMPLEPEQLCAAAHGTILARQPKDSGIVASIKRSVHIHDE